MGLVQGNQPSFPIKYHVCMGLHTYLLQGLGVECVSVIVFHPCPVDDLEHDVGISRAAFVGGISGKHMAV